MLELKNMSSPGIDSWIAKAPESWAKFAKKAKKTDSFEKFKTKFFEGAEKENKDYLKKYLTHDQLKHIYLNGIQPTTPITHPITNLPSPTKTKLTITRQGKNYERTNNKRWDLRTKFVLQLASKEKPKSKKYYEYVNILIEQGRTKQAVVKKIQRERKRLSK